MRAYIPLVVSPPRKISPPGSSLPFPVRTPKKAHTGRPSTAKRQKAQDVSASSLLKNCASSRCYVVTVDNADFSVELPEGKPFERPNEPDRTLVKYKFFICRTKSNNLPVYNIIKRGGSLLTTGIHHVEGDPRVGQINSSN